MNDNDQIKHFMIYNKTTKLVCIGPRGRSFPIYFTHFDSSISIKLLKCLIKRVLFHGNYSRKLYVESYSRMVHKLKRPKVLETRISFIFRL